MSNEVYGYFESAEILDKQVLLESLEKKTGLGINQISFHELYNYPEELLPSDPLKCTAFILGDRPGKTNATYLIDCLDYVSDADIGLPHKGVERLKLLVNAFVSIISEARATRFFVAVTDSSQIDEVKTVKLSNLEAIMIADFEDLVPPCCLYCVVID